MSVSRRFVLASIAFATSVFSPAVSGVSAQPDPAAPGVCYATLGNNASVPGALITINRTTGAGTLIGPTGISGQFDDPGVPALAIKTNGEMYATDIGAASKLYRIDATTGAATVVATTALNSPPAIAFNGDDILWAVDNSGGLHIVEVSTGSSRLVGPTGVFIKGLAFDPIDGALWGSDASGGVYTIDTYTGAATLVGNTGLPATPDIHFDGAGDLYGSSGGGLSGNNLIAIDKGSGIGSVIGPIGYVSVAGMAAGLNRIVPVAVEAYDARWAEGRVEVRWRLIDIEGTISFEVLRAEEDGRFASINAAPIEESRGEFVLVDEAVEPGVTYWYRVRVLEDGETITSFEASVRTPVLVASLDQNYPNPFNPSTQIRFSIGNPGHVSLGIYDISGRLIRTVVDRPMGAGMFFESWDGRDGRGDLVASGVYFYRLEAGKQVLTRKAVLMR